MLWLLAKKQLKEIFASYFVNKKTGKARSKAGLIGYFIFFTVIMLFVAGVFFYVAYGLSALTQKGNTWLYFAMMGSLSVLLGAFSSVFNTFTALYKAKDNELLLSLPIPPSKILASRIIQVYFLSFIYSAVVWIPTVVCYLVRNPSVLAGIYGILLTFIISLFVTVISCALGFVVAVISNKLNNKKIFTVIFSLLFFALYYFVYFKLNEFLKTVLANADAISKGMKLYGYPLYVLGKAAFGDTVCFFAITVANCLLFALCLFIMSKTYIKVITKNRGEKKTVYTKTNAPLKTSSVQSALLKREFKHFSQSPIWMLNSGLGVIILPLISIIALIKSKDICLVIDALSLLYPAVVQLVPIAVLSILCLTVSVDAVSASSVSLEGKTFWICRSLPISPSQIFAAKENMAVILNAVPSVIAVILVSVAFKISFSTAVYMCLVMYLYVALLANAGLALNVKSPNLNWVNESVPVKQSSPVVITLFGGWGISVLFSAAFFFLNKYLGMSCDMYLWILVVLLILAIRMLKKWLHTEGVKKFEKIEA